MRMDRDRQRYRGKRDIVEVRGKEKGGKEIRSRKRGKREK